MNYEILTTEIFYKKIKTLSKKYHSLIDDLETFKAEFLKEINGLI